MSDTDKDAKGDGKKKAKRFVLTVWELVIVVGIIGCMAAISTPKFSAARTRANTRACYANQKTLVGAIEMYNLDIPLDKAGKPAKPQIRTTVDLRSMQASLKTSGYLQSIPDDPGEGRGTFEHYELVTGGNGISCKVHGSIQ